MYRGTLRCLGYCKAWDVFIQLGATDDSYIVENSENMTYRDFINSFLAYSTQDSVELKFRHYLGIQQDDPIFDKFEWLGVFDDTKIGLKNATPAQILQQLLEAKWSLEPEDKDMIVMWHKFIFNTPEGQKEINSSMVCIGDDTTHTAMAKTVGYPIAIAVKMILKGTIHRRGVELPFHKNIYDPILKELATLGIVFNEEYVEPKGY